MIDMQAELPKSVIGGRSTCLIACLPFFLETFIRRKKAEYKNKIEKHSRMMNIQVFPSQNDGRKLFTRDTHCIRQSTKDES